MKLQLKSTFIVLFSLALLVSCDASKRKYIHGYTAQKDIQKSELEYSEIAEEVPNTTTETVQKQKKNRSNKGNLENEYYANSLYTSVSSDVFTPAIQTKNRNSWKFQAPQCDTIELKSNRIIIGKVTLVSDSEIRYKLCDNLDGPEYIAKVKDIRKITYKNGRTDNYIVAAEDNATPSKSNEKLDKRANEEPKKLEVFSLLGMIFGIMGLMSALYLGVTGLVAASMIALTLAIFVVAALTMSIIGLIRHLKNRGTYFGKGMAIAGIILGGIGALILAIILPFI